MYKQLSDKITGGMIEHDLIESTQKETYCYGLEILMAGIVNIITTIAISVFFGEIVSGLLFLAVYIPLRIYSGGYHASTELRCYLLSVLTLLIFLSAIKLIPDGLYLTLAVVFTVVSSLIILVLAPVGTPNKMLDNLEILVYRKRGRIIMAIEVLIFVSLLIVGEEKLAFSVGCSFLAIAIMLVIGKLVIVYAMLTAKHSV